jgi:CDP-6-deoxy-D-xylo-4-hexulose-3-dehydrase
MTLGLPLATTTWDDHEFQALDRVIKSGKFSMGAEVKSFESEFAAYLGVRHCVMTNSGSSANLLAVAALFYLQQNPLKRGDEVIVPAVSWSTTFFPLQQYGLKLKFIDISDQTLNLDLEQVKDAIGPRTRMIFGVNLLGNPIDYIELRKLVSDQNIYILEDNCESMGATLLGQQAGTFGLAGTFSSFFSHHISTMEGGMVATNNDELFHIMLSLRAHGWTRNLPTENLVSSKSEDAFTESFRFVLPGYNLRPLEMSGALGREQLLKLPEIVEGRRRNALVFEALFGDHECLITQKEVGESSWFGFALILKKDRLPRDKVLRKLGELNIETRSVVGGNFTRNPVMDFFDFSIHGELRNADLVHNCGFFVGNHHFDITEQLEMLSDALESAL